MIHSALHVGCYALRDFCQILDIYEIKMLYIDEKHFIDNLEIWNEY